ncbi:hypothetical protein HY992_00995 [Candidatus Micrarchaeota archaeon]|nr:hypothetical protein [Candidatus Micrarchaeota archaeon]
MKEKRFLKGDFDISQAGEKLGIIVGGIILLALIATMCATTGKPEKCGAGTVECDVSASSCGCCSAEAQREGGIESACSCPSGYEWDSSINDCCRNIDGGRECVNSGRLCRTGECPAAEEYCPASGCCPRGTWSDAEKCCVENGACIAFCPEQRACDAGAAACREWGGCCGEGLTWDSGRECCKDSGGQCVQACPACLTWKESTVGANDFACRDASGRSFGECARVVCINGRACCEQDCDEGTWDCDANGGEGCCAVNGVCVEGTAPAACVAAGRGCSGRSGGCTNGCCAPGFSWGASGSVQCCQSGGVCYDDGGGTGRVPERICEPNPCEYDLNNDRKLNPDDVNLWLEKCFVAEVVEVTETRTDAEGNPVQVVATPGVEASYRQIDECDYDVAPFAGTVSAFDENCVRDICKGEEEGWECTILACLE